MIYIDLPTISNGSTEQQLAELRSYVYKSNEQLNATLSNLTIDKIWLETANALSASSNYSDDEIDSLKTQYQKVRDLIIKTADSIVQTDERWNMALSGNYLAKSQFGEYLLETSVEIDGSSTGFKQLYTYSTELGSDYGNYKLYQQNFIKEGLLDDSGAEPIYGIDVGLLTSEFEVDGKVISVTSNKKVRVTPDELSLWNNDKKVAYLNSHNLYFPSAVITGGTININSKFMVDSEGNVTAKSGVFSGTIDANSLQTAMSNYSDYIKMTQTTLSFYEDGICRSYINNRGFNLYDGSNFIGRLGMNEYKHNYNAKGTVLELADKGKFISIGVTDTTTTDNDFISKIAYSRGGDDNLYEDEGVHVGDYCYFHFGINVENGANFNGCGVSGVDFTGGIKSNGVNAYTGTIKVIQSIDDIYVDNDGKVAWNYTQTYLQVRNGIITGFKNSSTL